MRQNTARKLLGLLLALAMVIGLLPGTFLTALAAGTTQSVSYVDAKGNAKGPVDCLPVTQSTTTLNNAWYVVNGEVVFEKTRLEVKGDVNLILADGCLLDAQYGIHVQKDARLTIWAQSTGSSMGALDAVNAQENNWDAAIGSNQGMTAKGVKAMHVTGEITINGGNIYADGSTYDMNTTHEGGPGIFGQKVTINGGYVEAIGKGIGIETVWTGTQQSAGTGKVTLITSKSKAHTNDHYVAPGIGGLDITINGGTVKATGSQDGAAAIGGAYSFNSGKITINGGDITAKGSDCAAAIGSGFKGSVYEPITINGGTITITEGSDNAAYIGAGRAGDLYGKITITGGDITCVADQTYTGESCIGTGLFGDIKGGTIRISGGTLNLIGGSRGPAIGAGAFCTVSKDARIIIEGGTINAAGGTGAAAIGGGVSCNFLGRIEISGGHVTATGGPDGGPGIGVGKTYVSSNIQTKIDSYFAGTISISGANTVVTAEGQGGGAGIGTGEDLGFDGTVTISGGTVTATSEIDGAGIGGGDDGHFGGKVTISGGEVTAKGATGGAGIGGGYGENGDFQGTVTVTGGNVTATGGADGGAGIGSGLGGNALDGHVHIDGGTVTAKGGTGGAGIGGGKESAALTHWSSGGSGCDDVKIIGGTVLAQSGEGACSAIGHGDDAGNMGRIIFTEGMRVQADSRTTGGIDGAYDDRDGNPYRANERDGACMYNHTALISACDHPLDAGINDGFISITETGHHRADCQYCGLVFEEEAHEMVDGTCAVCGYKDGLCTVSFDPNGGSGTMGVAKVASGTKYMLPECGFTAPAGKAFVGWSIDSQIYGANKPVDILRDTTAKAVWTRAYQLWVGDKQVTEDNAGDILGDGKASYDRQSNTLTLNGAWINSSAVYDRASGLTAGIIDGMGQLKIVVNGNSVVNVAEADYGVYSIGALSISGTARLSATGKNGIGAGSDLEVSVASLNAAGERYGINAAGNLTVYDSSLTAKGGECGIKSAKNIGVNGDNSVVTARATETGGQAVQAVLDIGFDSFLSIVTPAGGAKSNGTDDVTILNRYGDVAREVVIGKSVDYDVWVGQTRVTSDNCADVLGDGKVSYAPDTHTLTFAAAAPAISGTHSGAMIYAGHDLTVVAPEGGLTLESEAASHGIDADGDLKLQGDVTVNVMKQAIFAGEDFSVYGNLTARGMGSELTAEGLVVANGYIYIDGDLKGYNRTGYGLHAEDDIVVTGDVQLNVATGTTISAGAGIDIEGSLDNTGFDGQAQVPENGVVADDDIYLGSNVTLLANKTGIRSDNGNIGLYAERWEVNDATHGAVAIDAVKIYLPETSAFTAPADGAVKAYDAYGATRETIYSGDTVAAYATIGKKADAPTAEAAVPTVQVTPESATLTYDAENENRTLTASATVESETGLGTLYYYWQQQEEGGRWLDVADGADMTEYAVPVEQAVGEYTYRCLVVNALEDASAQAESNEVTVTIAKAAPEITAGPRATGLTYSGRPQRLAMGGSAVGGTMQYSLDGESWSDSVPTATNAGAYALHYRVLGDENHTDLPDEQLEVSIAKRRLVITVEGKEKTVGEADPALTYLAEGLVAGDMLEGQLTREAGEEAGTYLISAEAIQPAAYCRDNYTIVPQGGVLKIVALAFGTPDFTMPAELAEIQESAFEGLADMKVVDAHGCATIGKDAFKDTGLAQIRLPKDCDIDPEAFDDRKIYVFAPAGGSTEAYCAGHENLEFIAE